MGCHRKKHQRNIPVKEEHMRPRAIVFLAILLTIIVPGGRGQMIRITGTVKDADGTPVNGARIVVTVDGHKVSDLTSNTLGKYSAEVKAQQATMMILCTAIVDPDKVHYETNPLKKEPPFKDYDFIFRQVTASDLYWRSVTNNVDVKFANQHGVALGDSANLEWTSIRQSNLPPDSKAAAAHQFNTKLWSKRITDTTFSDYVAVDDNKLRLAMHGDKQALDSLPASVKNDVIVHN